MLLNITITITSTVILIFFLSKGDNYNSSDGDDEAGDANDAFDESICSDGGGG